jgi:hypothetical protein
LDLSEREWMVSFGVMGGDYVGKGKREVEGKKRSEESKLTASF